MCFVVINSHLGGVVEEAMGQATIGKFCGHCEQQRLFVKERTNHVLHALLSLLGCGLWLPVWAVIGFLNSRAPYRCSMCGSDGTDISSSMSVVPDWMAGQEPKADEQQFPWLNQ